MARELTTQERTLAEVYYDLWARYAHLPEHKILTMIGLRLLVRKHSYDKVIKRLVEAGVPDVAERAHAQILQALRVMRHLFNVGTSDNMTIELLDGLDAVAADPALIQYLLAFLQRMFDREAYLDAQR